MNSEPFADFCGPINVAVIPGGADFVERIKEEVRTSTPSVASREAFLEIAREEKYFRLDSIIGDENSIEYRNTVFGVRRYLVQSHQWPAPAPDSGNLRCKYELIGFPNYQGPTEVARLMFVVTETEWTDTIFVGDFSFKHLQAGTPLMPTGCLPMLIDHSSPSLGRVSEYLAVFPCAAMNVGLMGTTDSEWSQNVFFFMAANYSGAFGDEACLTYVGEILELPPEEAKDFKRFFQPSTEDQALLSTPERMNKLKVWLHEYYSSDKKLLQMEKYLSGRQQGNNKFLIGDRVSMADISLFLDMLRLYGRQIVREAIPDFRQRFPALVRHFETILREFPQLLEYLKDPSRHYKPTYAFLNQCEAVYSYGDLFDSINDNDESEDTGIDRDVEANSTNPIAQVLKAIEVATLSGEELHTVILDEERPCFQGSLKLLGVEVAPPSSRAENLPANGCCDLDAILELLPEHLVFKFAWIFVANAKGMLGATTATRTKNLQMFSVVAFLLATYSTNSKDFFKKEVLDRSRSGAMYTNVSPGNVQYLEILIEMNGIDRKDGVVCRKSSDNADKMSLADAGIYLFVQTILGDKEIIQCEDDERALREQFPLLMKAYSLLKKQWNLE